MQNISRRDFLKTAIIGGVGVAALIGLVKSDGTDKKVVMTSQKNNSPWPNGTQGAISLSFDDGTRSQLEIAIPILREYHLFGTFYIKPKGAKWEEKKGHVPWRDVALAGHEIGNHTINHICSRNFNFGGRHIVKSLETSTLDDIERDVVEAERRLNALIPEQRLHTFCYPCYQDYVGEGATRQSYVPIIAKYFPAARGIGEMANHPLYTDLHYLASWPVAGWMSGSDLRGFAEVAALQGSWVILTFHEFQHGSGSPWKPGSTYDSSPISDNSFRELCAHLVKQSKRIWTAPVVTVAEQIITWRKNMKQSSI